MNETSHPALDILAGYLAQPMKPEFTPVRRHLLVCQACRKRTQGLGVVQDSLKRHGPARPQRSDVSEALALRVGRYVDGDARPEERSETEALLRDQGEALKAALHYAAHSAAMTNARALERRAAENPESSAQAAGILSGFRGSLRDAAKLFSFKAPLWLSVPATAGAVLVVVMVAATGNNAPVQVAAYQDQGLIHFQPSGQLPGVGFFGTASNTSRAYGNAEVAMVDESTLSMRWPAVDKASDYKLTITLVDDGRTTTVVERVTKMQEIRIEGFVPQLARRYEWTLSGQTIDGMRFHTKGGFVFNRRHGS